MPPLISPPPSPGPSANPSTVPEPTPREFPLEIAPRARFDVIDIRQRIAERHGEELGRYPRTLYYSFHTTAGYLEQGLAARLAARSDTPSLAAGVNGDVGDGSNGGG